MVDEKFDEFFRRILIINLITSIIFSSSVFLFNISLVNILFAVLPIVIKCLLWLGRNSFLAIEETTDKARLTITLSFITFYFAIDVIIFNNFIPAAILLVIPILMIALKKDMEMIKIESAVTVIFMILILTISIFVTPFKSNVLSNFILYVTIVLQLLFIIKRFTDETLLISAKSDFFMDKSKKDGMTGLYNNSTFYETVTEKVQLMAPFCIIIINIDNFKTVKNTYGGPFADYVLKTLVKTIKKSCRDQDMGFRYGGEDVAVIFPRTTDDEAFKLAENLRKNFSEKTYEHNTEWIKLRKPITISIGLIENNKRGTMPQELIEKCHQALYYSKENGKNQTTIYHEHILEWEDKFEDFRRKYRDYER